MRNAFASLAFIALSAVAAPAAADDFVFNVPVRIENADAIVRAMADCTVVYTTEVTGERFVSARESVPVVGGAYSGTIAVRVVLPAGATRADARQWSCEARLFMPNADGPQVELAGNDAARRAQYTAATGRTVTSSAYRTLQAFPRP